MFSVLLLFIFTFSLAAIVSFIVVKIFNPYISAIFERIIQDKISGAWHKYIQFAAYITGISGGVNIYRIDDYITENSKIQFNLARWLLEVYRTGISALQKFGMDVSYCVFTSVDCICHSSGI